MRMPTLLAGLLAAGVLCPPTWAACPDEAAVTAYLLDFRAGRPSRGFGPDLSPAEAACARARLVARLPELLGPLAGYKAIFTNPASQQRFGVAGPDWGAMFARALLGNGARLPAAFGALPRYEPDFIVIVKDAGLAEATTPAEALAHIDALVPFIELPDIMLAGNPGGIELVAANAAFRAGVLGAPIAVTDSNAGALLAALESMEVVVSEERSGSEIGRAKGSVLMGHPLHAALWLARALKNEGIALRPGDLLSLGGFLAAAPTRPGTRLTVRYLGLPGDPAVSVDFD